MINGVVGSRLILIAIAVALISAFVWYSNDSDTQKIVKITIPGDLSLQASAGKLIFEKKCSACHGNNAEGSDSGPPLIHKIYEPNHHSDASFFLAAKKGVRSHHWPFGNMPPVSGVTDNDIAAIVNYVRTLQKANGIF